MEMEALDLLKKSWQKDDFVSNQISSDDIYKMLRKKSSSTVKWIFIISLIELSLGLILNIILSLTNVNSQSDDLLKKFGLYEINLVVTALMYAVIVFFIFNFYKSYKKIITENNTKDLINSILKTRKVVKRYIAFNLITLAVLVICFGGYGFIVGYSAEASKLGESTQIPLTVVFIGIFVIIIITAIFILIAWLVYRLLYGILLKKLNKNYEELKKIDL